MYLLEARQDAVLDHKVQHFVGARHVLHILHLQNVHVAVAQCRHNTVHRLHVVRVAPKVGRVVGDDGGAVNGGSVQLQEKRGSRGGRIVQEDELMKGQVAGKNGFEAEVC